MSQVFEKDLAEAFGQFIGRPGFSEDDTREAEMLDAPQDDLPEMAGRDVISDLPLFDPFLDDAEDDAGVTPNDDVGFALEISWEISHFQEQDLCEHTVGIVDVEVRPNEFPELVERPFNPHHVPFDPGDVRFQEFLQNLVKEISAVLEIFVDEALVDAGGPRDVGPGDGAELLFAQERPEGIHDLDPAGRGGGAQILSCWMTGGTVFHGIDSLGLDDAAGSVCRKY